MQIDLWRKSALTGQATTLWGHALEHGKITQRRSASPLSARGTVPYKLGVRVNRGQNPWHDAKKKEDLSGDKSSF
ncbi:Hypothetical protein Cp262_2168 [Corynebacterium pseudotuberculosis]|uniref:hypothetical protein n=1 Tax=Corynebacterium pseudotuberculosis TaxID=1719 RepID=UPI000AD04AE5|nr:hypothetical protein [Corynebacterium pseudotuberculosis]ARX64266.1 Hypothetical protein Cp262_2168 [Corynebacterium pseudotuberculosis]